MLSIAIPIHDMKNKDFFLNRCLESIRSQTYQDYEIVITEEGKMAENTNAAIRQCKGDLIKVLYMDDWLAHKDALKNIVNAMKDKDTSWLITGVDTNPNPRWTPDIHTGNNKLGSPSALTMRKNRTLLFDENLSWLLDCDLYYRMARKYGTPTILSEVNVNIGIHDGQMTNLMSDKEKRKEFWYMQKKYEKD